MARVVSAKPSRDMTAHRDNIVAVRCEAVEPMAIRRSWIFDQVPAISQLLRRRG
jgi:hypothetical protein